MKKLIFASNVLGRVGIALSFVLPAIGVSEAAYYGPGQALSQSTSPYSTSSAAETQLNLLRANQELAPEAQKWQGLHDRNDGLVKAQGQVKRRAQDVLEESETNLNNLRKAAKNGNPTGIEGGINALQSSLSGNMHKECKANLNFGNLSQMAQKMKEFYGNVTANLSKQSGTRAEDIKAKAQRLAAEELARQEALEKENPAEAQFNKQFAELMNNAKDPKKFVEYLKTSLTNANQNAGDAVKKNSKILSKMLLNPDGLLNLLAEAEKDNELFEETANQLMNMASSTFKGVVTESEAQVSTLADNCQFNRSKVMSAKNDVLPALAQSQAHSARKKKSIQAMFASATKANCESAVDFNPLKAAATTAEQNMRNAIAARDSAGFFTAFTQATSSVGDSLAQVTTSVKPLLQDCNLNGKIADKLKEADSAEVIQTVKSGADINQIAGDPSQGAPASSNSSVPALGNAQPRI